MAGYICALAISLFAVITGIIFMIYPLYHKHVCNEPATANVIAIHMEWRDDHWHSYPVFQYQADGKTVIIQHNVSPTSYEIGDQVELRYNQKNPEQYYIPHASGGNWMFLFGGLFFFLIGFGFTALIIKVWLLPLILRI